MVSKIIIIAFYTFLSLGLRPTKAQTWIRAGYYWNSQTQIPISNINSALYTHLICGFAGLNSTSYQLSVLPSDEIGFASFTNTVKRKNPSVTTLLSIGGPTITLSFSSMVRNQSYRKSFIDSSIKTARLYGFQGLDLWIIPNTRSDMFNMGILFGEWQAAIVSEAIKSNHSQLILTATVDYSPYVDSASYPIDSIQRNLNWVHVLTTGYTTPSGSYLTGAHAALYNPDSEINTDYGIKAWINAGLSSNKLVFCLPFYGYAWKLANPRINGFGAPATGPEFTVSGAVAYKQIKTYIDWYGGNAKYNATYVVKYFSIGSVWICFDDAEVVRIKISYAKEQRLLGYFVWQVSYDDDNLELSQAVAQVGDKIISSVEEEEENGTYHLRIPLLAIVVFCYCIRKLKSTGTVDSAKQANGQVNNAVPAGDFNKNARK